MTRIKSGWASTNQSPPGASTAVSTPPRTSGSAAPAAVRLLDEVEAVARIGSYALDIASGRWTSSKGCDAIFGIDAGFERSVESWASLTHPGDRDVMVAYFAEDVVSRGQPFDRQYRIVRADTGESRWVQGRGTLSFDPSGKPVRMFGSPHGTTPQDYRS